MGHSLMVRKMIRKKGEGRRREGERQTDRKRKMGERGGEEKKLRDIERQMEGKT